MTRATTRGSAGRRRYFRIAVWCLVGMLASAFLLPLTGYVYVGIQEARAQAVQDTNPRANTWRAARGGIEGYSAVSGRPMPDEGAAPWINRETDTLINGSGQNWRALRNGVVASWGGWVLLAVLVVIGAFFMFRGRMTIEGGRSGTRVKRWSDWERFVHWTTAVSFVLLAVTGLSLFFGRVVLIPLLGYKGFSIWAQIARELHEFIGPWIFTPAVALMIVTWIMNNLPEKGDLEWLTRAGGMFGGKHPSSGFANAGEKVWFWFIATVGVASVVAGIVLAFPLEWGQTRDTMQLANLIHGAGTLVWIAIWFGHAYLGTIGTEGALEGMTTGYVDVNWAKQHHDRWYAEIADTAEHLEAGEERTVTRSEQQPATS